MTKVVNRVVHIPKANEKNQLIDEIIKIRQIINNVADRNDPNIVMDLASMQETPVISIHPYESMEEHEHLLGKLYENKDFLTQADKVFSHLVRPITFWMQEIIEPIEGITVDDKPQFLLTNVWKAARGKRWELVEMLREGRAKKEGVKPALSVNITGDFDLVFMRLPLRSLSEFTFFLKDVPNISKMGEIALSHNRHIANVIHY